MNNKHLTEEQIAVAAESINNDQYDSLPDEVKEHLSECDQCSSEVVVVSELIKDDKDIITLDKGKSRLLKRVIPVAAAVIIIVGAFYLFKINNTDTNESIAIIPEDTVDQNPDKRIEINKDNDQDIDKKEIIIPENVINENKALLAYQSNDDLEKIYNRFRDGNLRASGFKIITDSLLETSDQSKLILEWEGISDELIIEIFNNNGEKITDTTFTGTRFNIISIKTPALYYWKLINSDFEMLYCGKIILNK